MTLNPTKKSNLAGPAAGRRRGTVAGGSWTLRRSMMMRDRKTAIKAWARNRRLSTRKKRSPYRLRWCR